MGKLWICPRCRRGTTGESACTYCSAPRSSDHESPTADPWAIAPPTAAPGIGARELAAIAVAAVVAVVGLLGGLVLAVNSYKTAAKSLRTAAPRAGSLVPARGADGDPVYTPPVRKLPPRTAMALPAALTAAPAPGPVVTPAGARSVVQAAWDLHHQALTRLDVRLMAAFETGPALVVDAGRCECSNEGDPFGPMNDVAVSVPRQTTYPAHFLAQVSTTASNQPWIGFLVFTRANAGSPWLLDLIGGFATTGPATLTPPAIDADGYLAPQTAQPATDPAGVHALLADYWREAKRTGTVPPSSVFEPGIWTTGFAQKLTTYHQGGIAENGLIGYYAYQTDTVQDGAYAFPEGQGWEIVCSAIHMQKTFVPGPGRDAYQDLDQMNWGKSVPPGAHSAITMNDIAVPCMEIPPAGSGQKVRVKGAQEYTDVTSYK